MRSTNDRLLEAKLSRLRALDDRDFELWKFFEARADQIKTQLWTSGTWLIALQVGLLAFLVGERFMNVAEAGTITAKVPLFVSALSAIGIALSILMAAVIMEIAEHVRTNWNRASGAKGDYAASLRGGVINITVPLYAVDVSLLLAFGYLFSMSFEKLTPIALVLLLPALASVIYLLGSTFVFSERPESEEQGAGTQKSRTG